MTNRAKLKFEHATWGPLDVVVKPSKDDYQKHGNSIRKNTGEKAETRPDLWLCVGHVYSVEIFSSMSLELSSAHNMYIEANYMGR